MAAPTCVLTVVKRFPYRGNAAEEWSNTYAFSGATPADSAAWNTLFGLFMVEERKVYTSDSAIVAGYGYNRIPEKGDHAIWSLDMTVAPNTPNPGSLALTGNRPAGDQAAWVRWGLDRYNSNGKRVYLRKYFHSGQIVAGGGDALLAAYTTALNAFGTKMMDGSFATGRKIVDKDGNVPINAGVSPFITTRTLKRRGKRPPT